MTYKEKLKQMCPDNINDLYGGGCLGCPVEYGWPNLPGCDGIYNRRCDQCWNREISNAEEALDSQESMTMRHKGVLRDSGERRQFDTGAVRDMAEGKGDMVSIPWEAILRLSKHYEAGAKKYNRWNFRKGIPVSSFIDSACRHLAKYQCGLDDEDHLAAAAFNILGAMLMENTLPEMQDLPLREGKNTFNYFMEETK
jgi:hypothetical protein